MADATLVPDTTAAASSITNGNAPPSARRFPARPPLRVDVEAVIRSVEVRLEALRQDRDRGQWMEARLQRYAKYRGWLAEKTFPWPGAANVHPPILQIAELRSNAALHNALLTRRPLLSAKAAQSANVPKEQRITDLIDWQLFVEPGSERAERVIGDYVSAFLQDGNAVLYTPWVRDARTITTTVHRAVPPGAEAETELLALLAEQCPGGLLVGVQGSEYTLEVPRPSGPTSVTAIAYQDDAGALEVVIERDETIYDGPVVLPLAIDQVYVSTRCENLQPPSEWNPGGAPYVIVTVGFRLDDIRRGQASGRFNQLDADGLEKIEAWAKGQSGASATGDESEAMQQQKDTLEGREHTAPITEAEEDADLGHAWVPALMVFDRWDLDGSGLQTDAYWIIAPDARVLLEARRLTDRWPAVRPYRPLAEACAIPVPGRYYGIGLLELGEPLYDLIKGTFDQAYDSASLSNLPFGFYAAGSKMMTEVIRMAPGELYPVPGSPKETLWFPNLPTRDQSWAFQVIGLANQFFERLVSIGDIQLGRVPTGKASALRTFGTTAALLQQGDVRADQLLVRLFSGLRQVARFFHLMNRALLPPGKEIRRIGWMGERAQAYVRVDPAELDAEMDFEFRPDFLLTNGPMLAQAIQSMLAVTATPLAMQLGIVDPQRFHNAIADFVRALKLDPARYLKLPDEGQDPPILAEEAISLIHAGHRPSGPPLEGPEVHLKKLGQFLQSDAFGLLSPTAVALFRAWTFHVQQAAQQQQLLQAAQGFQQMLAQGGGGQMSPMQEPGIGAGLGAGAPATASEGTGETG